jgi:hypothetical protein
MPHNVSYVRLYADDAGHSYIESNLHVPATQNVAKPRNRYCPALCFG